jgi:hypothetical protein
MLVRKSNQASECKPGEYRAGGHRRRLFKYMPISASLARFNLARFNQDTFDADWSQFDPWGVLRYVLAIAAPLLVCIAAGHPRFGLLIAAGAFSVGFGSFQQIDNSRARPMLLAACGMCVASWAGTLAGDSAVATVLLSAAAAFIYAVMTRRSPAASWVVLQCGIWLIISTAYPAHGLPALNRGALILAGGLLQTAVLLMTCRIGMRHPQESAPQQPTLTAASLERSRPWTFALRAAFTLAIAAALYRWLSRQNGYWLPMTALILLRPALRDTFQRGHARLVGTIAGAVVASVIVALASGNPWLLACGVIVFAWASYALFKVNNAYFAGALTAYVVFLLSLAGVREQTLLEHRIIFTAAGGAVAFVLHWVAVQLEQWVHVKPPLPSIRATRRSSR